jgi:hypothetical protein
MSAAGPGRSSEEVERKVASLQRRLDPVTGGERAAATGDRSVRETDRGNPAPKETQPGSVLPGGAESESPDAGTKSGETVGGAG